MRSSVKQPLPGPIQMFPLISHWLSFGNAGIVRLRTGRVELGQGNYTALVQIAADELDVLPEQVSLVGGDTRETPNEGFTSGSQSISVGGLSVRIAASGARRVLLSEAAKLLQARLDDLTVVGGVIHHGANATDLDYWTLANGTSLDVDACEQAQVKPSNERRLSGTSLPRLDLSERIIGTPFVHDLAFEDTLHGRAVHPPSMLAHIESVDLPAIEQRPGVVAATRDGSFIGIVAAREEDAIAAAHWAYKHIKWSNPGGISDHPRAYMAGSTAAIEVVHRTGDVTSAEGSSYETEVSRPYISHGSIGPSCALAKWDEGRLLVWSHTQGVFPLRAALSDVFGISVEAIDVVHVFGAGCYGHNGADDVALDAALMAQSVPGQVVRVQWSRADEFRAAPLGSAMVTQAKAIVDCDDRITAMEVIANSAPHGNRPGRNGAPNLRASAYLHKPFPIPLSKDIPASNGGGADRNATPPYSIPNQLIAKRLVHDLPYRTSSLRGLGAFTNVFAIETLMDDISTERGIDPVEFRLKHLDDPRALEVVKETAKLGDWRNCQRNEGIGYGFAFAQYKNTAAYCAVMVRIEVDSNVRVTHAWSHVDTGEVINPDGVINQIEGGIIQSASWTLKEGIQVDRGVVTSVDWETYPILRFSEVPEISVSLASRPDEDLLGCAEAAQGPTAAAIGNAVRDALGVRIRDLPLNREAIVSAMQ